ncbi:MAG: hypothetical protein ACO1N2_01845 [Candidatus Saccharimonadota bacterium]
MLVTIVTILALIILLALTIFQLALVFGAPLGAYAWGGQHKVLPTNLRVSSIGSIILYILFAGVIASKAGFISGLILPQTVNFSMYVFAAYFTLGIFMNAISKSKNERLVMTPVAAVLAMCFWVVALN